jgi:hypothetical protein
LKKLAALFVIALVGTGAASAVADNPHPPGCNGDPHRCATETITVPGPTQIVTLPAVTVPGPSASVPPIAGSSSSSSTVTVVTIAVPSAGKTVFYSVKVKVKKIRRYCTMQRHGWRCTGHPPRARKR